jgi:hypothetical protein
MEAGTPYKTPRYLAAFFDGVVVHPKQRVAGKRRRCIPIGTFVPPVQITVQRKFVVLLTGVFAGTATDTFGYIK